jgi:class 3 adenylate cyclase/tetratricopeptide (TPR) repeat protein
MDVGAWLSGLGLEQYAEAFARNDVDGDTLPRLTAEDLADIGVKSVGHRRKLLDAINQLAKAEAESTRSPESEVGLEAERRQVTVLFADLSGFTKFSRDLGAEETHALLNRYFEVVDGIVDSYGGSIDKHIGDNVMAVFGAPVAHDDDPLRAVGAALAIQERMSDLSEELGHAVEAHIGIASGQVVASGTGSDAHREYTVTGDSVNLASRLQERAEPGQTLIADSVQRAVASHVECDALGEVVIKGLDAPVQAWCALALRGSVEGKSRGSFVGRRTELRQFAAVAEACCETGRGQAIVVRGEAGIGKTRMVEEFTAIAKDQGFVDYKGLVLDFGVGKGQDAIRTIVRRLVGIPRAGGEALREKMADTTIEEGLLTGDQRVFLSDLLDLPQPVEARATYDAMDNATRNEGKRNVVADLIRAVSGRMPILVIVEDVHWADPLTLSQLASMTAAMAECRAILVMTSRVEGDPLDQAWRSATRGSPLMTIDLGPLRAEDAIAMAGAFVDATNRFAKSCVERAEGNPLFLEQLLRNAEEHGEGDIPASIQSLVLARMDRLSTIDKRALQAASVIGQRFEPDVLNHLLETDEYDCQRLVRQGLTRAEGSEFLFTHALIQEGAYGSLLKKQRQGLHKRCAEWFADDEPELYAEHLDYAGDPHASNAYLQAACDQAGQYRFERALSLANRGLARPDKGAVQHRLRCLKGELLHELDQVESSIAVFQEALDQASDDVERCEAWMGLAAGMRVTTDFQSALDLLEHAEPIAVRHNLTQQLSRLHHLRGNLYFAVGKIEGCRKEHKLGLDFAREAQSLEDEARALGGLADAANARGQMRTAYESFRSCVNLCRENGFGRVEVANRSQMANSFVYLGAMDRVLTVSREAVGAAERVGHHRAEMNALSGICHVAVEIGDPELLSTHAERGLALARKLGARNWEPSWVRPSAWALYLRGERESAEELIKQAVANEAALAFSGGVSWGMLSVVTDNPETRKQALREGETLLRKGARALNHLHFYRHAMNACWQAAMWEELERFAQALEDYTHDEPLPWSDFFIARGRALAASGRKDRQASIREELRSLLRQANRMGYRASVAALDEALASV